MASEIVTEEQVRMAAYYLWLAEGQPTGEDETHWHRARAQLESSACAEGGPTASPRRPRAKAAAPASRTARKAAEKSGARQEA